MLYYFASKVLVLQLFATLTEDVDSARLEGMISVKRQMLGDQECPFSGVIVWSKRVAKRGREFGFNPPSPPPPPRAGNRQGGWIPGARTF